MVIFNVLHQPALLHLPPLRFHLCLRLLDQTQDYCVATLTLAVRPSDDLTIRLDLSEMVICTHQTFEDRVQEFTFIFMI
jgi:hypothetical protein